MKNDKCTTNQFFLEKDKSLLIYKKKNPNLS